MRFAAICSTGGSVLRYACAADPFVAERLCGIVTDRPCGAEALGAERGVPVVRIEATGDEFGDRAAAALEELGAGLVVVFFTRILRGALLRRFDGRLVNFHPSILPAFPGLHGVEDALAAGVKVLGTTVHLVDDGVDTGPIVCQTSFPVGGLSPTEVRHQVFVDQVRCLVQLVHWADEGRLRLAGRRVEVARAAIPADARYVPPLEVDAALAFDPPAPG